MCYHFIINSWNLPFIGSGVKVINRLIKKNTYKILTILCLLTSHHFSVVEPHTYSDFKVSENHITFNTKIILSLDYNWLAQSERWNWSPLAFKWGYFQYNVMHLVWCSSGSSHLTQMITLGWNSHYKCKISSIVQDVKYVFKQYPSLEWV